MKRRTPHRSSAIRLRAAAAIVAASLGIPTLAAGAGQTVTARATNLRNDHGALQCTLFADRKGYPDHPEAAVATRRVPIAADRSAACVFEGVAPGEYAIGVMHDENGNGKFDQGLFGIPLEGYGFSNNHTHALSAPSWEESRFTVASGEDRVLDITLRY